MIALENISKKFASRTVLDNLSFSVPSNSIFAFVGANGTGKTTTIKIIATLLRSDSGQVLFDGVPLEKDPRSVRRLIGYMPDYFGVYNSLSCLEYLEFYAGCHAVPLEKRRVIANELLELVNLSDRRDDYVDHLSRGLKQRLGLARALVHDPSLLLLDEPASGLDPMARIELRELLRELSRMKKTIIISSHILPELEEFSTHVGFLSEGKMAFCGAISEMRSLTIRERQLRLELANPLQYETLEPYMSSHVDISFVEKYDDHLVFTINANLSPEILLRDLIMAGYSVRSFGTVGGDLSQAMQTFSGGEY